MIKKKIKNEIELLAWLEKEIRPCEQNSRSEFPVVADYPCVIVAAPQYSHGQGASERYFQFAIVYETDFR